MANFKGKLVLILVVLLVFLYGMVGMPQEFSMQGLRASIGERINLGLDLRGGTHLILQVMVDEAVNTEVERGLERLREDLRGANINYGEIRRPPNQPDTMMVTGVPDESVSDLRRIVTENLPDYEMQAGPEGGWIIRMRGPRADDVRQQAVAQAIETIRNRVDQLGVAEPEIREHGLGAYQIVVQLPGVDDPQRVKEIMRSTAMLEIRKSVAGPYGSEQEALAAHGGILPPDTIMMRGLTVAQREGTATEQVYLVSRAPVVAGTQIRDASPIRDEFGRPAVRFVLTGEGGRRFASFTRQNIGENLAVVLDNRVREVATIRDEIRDEGRITGGFTEQQTRDLSMMLRSGALPASIRYLEERTVGPSLGADSVRAGLQAGVAGVILVLGFMLIYYRGAGVNAVVAMILNLIVLMGFMGFTGAPLTLPGIAGVVLIIGMGVDANVLIFERIREELRAGKSSAAAVEHGFGRAWLTIVDTNVTTMVAAAILFIFGSGPVRGFAVTLTFGLLANLFTAVFVSRVIFDWLLSRKHRGAALSI